MIIIEEAKGEMGLDEYEVRIIDSWVPPHHLFNGDPCLVVTNPPAGAGKKAQEQMSLCKKLLNGVIALTAVSS
jgi:hypothetical protein